MLFQSRLPHLKPGDFPKQKFAMILQADERKLLRISFIFIPFIIFIFFITFIPFTIFTRFIYLMDISICLPILLSS
jgi:hypothetical protein